MVILYKTLLSESESEKHIKWSKNKRIMSHDVQSHVACRIKMHSIRIW